jgi:hypothetical protein
MMSLVVPDLILPMKVIFGPQKDWTLRKSPKTKCQRRDIFY